MDSKSLGFPEIRKIWTPNFVRHGESRRFWSPKSARHREIRPFWSLNSVRHGVTGSLGSPFSLLFPVTTVLGTHFSFRHGKTRRFWTPKFARQIVTGRFWSPKNARHRVDGRFLEWFFRPFASERQWREAGANYGWAFDKRFVLNGRWKHQRGPMAMKLNGSSKYPALRTPVCTLKPVVVTL